MASRDDDGMGSGGRVCFSRRCRRLGTSWRRDLRAAAPVLRLAKVTMDGTTPLGTGIHTAPQDGSMRASQALLGASSLEPRLARTHTHTRTHTDGPVLECCPPCHARDATATLSCALPSGGGPVRSRAEAGRPY
jgi:hypothetical protein